MPGKTYRPGVRWWWSGGAVETSVLGEQLEYLAGNGFGYVEINPFGKALPADDPAVKEVYTDAADHARGRITCVAHHWTRDADSGGTDLVWHLRYDDEYAPSGDGWRIRRRALTINAIETRPIRRIRD